MPAAHFSARGRLRRGSHTTHPLLFNAVLVLGVFHEGPRQQVPTAECEAQVLKQAWQTVHFVARLVLVQSLRAPEQ